ncbi:MAG: TetR/AcrR family transcriptional regulator [Eubacterium sp.]|jgi:TetR/AcrR family transcriptional regulator
MLKKLTDEQLENILETAIGEFGARGLERAAIIDIARKAGVSSGVIYKYYRDKDDLFKACLERSLKVLDESLSGALHEGDSLEVMAENLISTCIDFSKAHPSYIRMYHAITSDEDEKTAKLYAPMIESVTAGTYTRLISEGKKEGLIRKDADPAISAFLFDNMLMMLHFSYGCSYYKERLKVFCGDGALRDKKLKDQMMKFIGAALLA